MRSSRQLLPLLILLVFTTTATGAETATETVPASPGWGLSGTTLVLLPEQPFERGFVRIVGPGGYHAYKEFEASASPTLDLLSDGRTHDGKCERRQPAETAGCDLTLTTLPDGHYRFEALLAGQQGTVLSRGSLFAGGGSLSLRAGDATPTVPTGRTLAQSPLLPEQTPVPNVLTEPERITITDDNNSGLTVLEMHANNSSGDRIENWEIQNLDGDLRIVEDGAGLQNAPWMTFLDDLGGRVGIGTTAPGSLLHISSATSESPRLRIEDDYQALGGFWDLRATSLPFLDYFEILNRNGVSIVQLEKAAPAQSLKINFDGVTIGTNLEVASSRDSKQNFLPIDPLGVLDRVAALPIQEWEFRNSTGARHLGPFAEDFHQAFKLGSSDKTISPMDIGGVTLAAIQGLQAKLDELEAANAALLTERDAQRERLEALEAQVALLASAPDTQE